MSHARGVLGGLVAAVVVVAVYLWDDLVLAAPIVVANRVWGTWPTFVLFSVLYAAGSFLIAMAIVRWSERGGRGRDNVLSRWATAQSERRRGTWGARLVQAGTFGAFVVASVVIGGILTTWFVHLSGRRDGIERTAALSCAIFGLSFTALYTLVGEGVGRI